MRARGNKLEDRRRQLREAATRVFARKGFHESRIADIATEAGVAYGLVYHYFKNKEEILNAIFEENWSFFVRAIEGLRAGEGTFAQRLDACVALMLESYRVAPDVVSVMVVEVVRSPKALDEHRLAGFRRSFTALAELIAEGKKSGDVRKDVDPILASICLIGSLETILTGVVLKLVPATHDNIERVRRQVVELFMIGLSPKAHAA